MTERVSDYGEAGLLSLIATMGTPDSTVFDGIGDDGAVVTSPFHNPMVMATDAMVEGTHFRREWCGGESVGRKLLAVNCSDMAAMGARPRYALLTVGFPPSLEWSWVTAFFRGLVSSARLMQIRIVGGDTVRSTEGIFLNLAVVGECVTPKALRRSDAKPGDLIYVTGPLGLAAYGLRTVSEQWEERANRPLATSAFLEGKARLDRGVELAEWGKCHAAMDLSDGLVKDLPRLAKSSDVQLTIDLARIPLASEPAIEGVESALALAVYGGEDYELIFTASESPPFPAHCIGEVSVGHPSVLWVYDGQTFSTPPLASDSFLHF